MSPSDIELIEQARDGDQAAFEELYKRYVRKIYNLAYRMAGGGQEAEELTQEVFLQAYKNLAHFKGESSFYTWLYRVACNTCLQHLRKKSRRRETVNFDDLAEVQISGHESPDPLDTVARRELERRLEKALALLPESQRMVILLGPIQGLSYEKMADALGLTVPIVKSRLHRARENLRRLCKEEPAAEGAAAVLVEEE